MKETATLDPQASAWVKSRKKQEVEEALKNDPRVKAWIAPNLPLFEKSYENADMFLTTHRIRNAYEILLSNYEVKERITDERDMLLIQRFFDMSFYPPKSLSLTQWKNGSSPEVRIVEAFKESRWKPNHRRPYEITLILDNGKTFQIDPGEIIKRFFDIKENFEKLLNSTL
jgi:hypothetical protein